VRRAIPLVLLVLVAASAVGGAHFLARDDDPVTRADAVVVLAGSESRLDVGLDLVREGVAPVLVVSEDVRGRDDQRTRFCDDGGAGERLADVEVICRKASPYSTRGESRVVGELVDKRAWKSLVVVTSRYHLFRAERLIQRCTDAKLAMRGAPEGWLGNIVAVPMEWVKLGLAETTRRGC
jgi:hypothetical protein